MNEVFSNLKESLLWVEKNYYGRALPWQAFSK